MKIPKREFAAEFKEQSVKRVKLAQGIGVVAGELGLSEQTLRNGVKASDHPLYFIYEVNYNRVHI